MIACPADSAPLAALLQQVREEYGKMPGLKLTKPQAMRVFGVAPSVCAAMLRALVMENFLSRAGDGVFVRSTTDLENEPRRHVFATPLASGRTGALTPRERLAGPAADRVIDGREIERRAAQARPHSPELALARHVPRRHDSAKLRGSHVGSTRIRLSSSDATAGAYRDNDALRTSESSSSRCRTGAAGLR